MDCTSWGGQPRFARELLDARSGQRKFFVCRKLAANFQQAELQLMQAHDHSRQDKQYRYHGEDHRSDTDFSNGQQHCHLDHHFVITVSTLTSNEEIMKKVLSSVLDPPTALLTPSVSGSCCRLRGTQIHLSVLGSAVHPHVPQCLFMARTCSGHLLGAPDPFPALQAPPCKRWVQVGPNVQFRRYASLRCHAGQPC